MSAAVQELAGWGRWPRRTCRTLPLDPGARPRGEIARGLGRAYGDAALNPALTRMGRARDRFLDFDPETGLLTAEAGVSLAEILEVFVPRGWFLPVTPGTRFVTLGGALSADVHGKNHHGTGSFGDHVAWFDLLCADGGVRRCSPQENPDLFRAAIGGMGLLGHVLAVALRMMPVTSAWIAQRTLAAPNLDAAIALFEAHLDVPYSVAWIDCLARGADQGRSLVMLGDHMPAEEVGARPFGIPAERPRRMPMDAPRAALNRFTIRAFNALYYRRGQQGGDGVRRVSYIPYFYPLDAILGWNRLYGRSGFTQYQCALPLATARDGLAALLSEIAAAGEGSFLAVLKRFGPGAPERPLSFPIEGYTLALDFAMSPSVLTLLNRLDEIVVMAGGRLYLAKDARMTQKTFETGYGAGLESFQKLRADTGAQGVFRSLLSERLGL